MSAASVAAGVRADRAAVLADVLGALGEHDPRVNLIKATVLAEAIPGAGKVNSRRILASLGIAPSARWGDLPAELAASVVAALTAPAPTGGGASPAGAP